MRRTQHALRVIRGTAIGQRQTPAVSVRLYSFYFQISEQNKLKLLKLMRSKMLI